ncbi:MAG: ABC transporter permease [Candidatus Limnocylindria bacterium]
MSTLGRVALPAAAALVASFLGLPIVALVARALTGNASLDGSVIGALRLSLITTAFSLVLILALGTPLAWILARRRFIGRRLLEVVVDLPIVLPPAVAGLALLLLLGRSGPVGAIGLDIAFTTAAVVLAQTFVAAPFYVRAARGAFATVHRDLEDAARIDGGSDWDVFRRVTLPLAAPILTGGAILAWARALGEFGATIMFAGNVLGVTQTLPLAVYGEFQSSLDASVAAAAVLVGAAFVVLFGIRMARSVSDVTA